MIGPAGVAIHTHQIVAAFQSTNVRAAQPAIRHQSLAEGPYDALIHKSGTSAKRSVNPLPPSQPKESSMADKRTYKSFLRIYFFYHSCKDSTSYQQYKISTPTNGIFLSVFILQRSHNHSHQRSNRLKILLTIGVVITHLLEVHRIAFQIVAFTLQITIIGYRCTHIRPGNIHSLDGFNLSRIPIL